MKLESDCSSEQSLTSCYGEFEKKLYNMLPEERKKSVTRAKSNGIAIRRVYVGVFLQSVLSKETGVSIEHLQYRYNEWGKPELDVEKILQRMEGDCEVRNTLTRLHFNLSHSGDYAVLAVSNHPIGIDVEYKIKNYRMLSERCFCESEYQDIMSGETEQEREKRFLEYWTMKEAYVKCVGEGLRVPLDSFQLQRNSGNMSVVQGKDMYLSSFFLDETYCISVCSSSVSSVKEIVKQKRDGLQLYKYDRM